MRHIADDYRYVEYASKNIDLYCDLIITKNGYGYFWNKLKAKAYNYLGDKTGNIDYYTRSVKYGNEGWINLFKHYQKNDREKSIECFNRIDEPGKLYSQFPDLGQLICYHTLKQSTRLYWYAAENDPELIPVLSEIYLVQDNEDYIQYCIIEHKINYYHGKGNYNKALKYCLEDENKYGCYIYKLYINLGYFRTFDKKYLDTIFVDFELSNLYNYLYYREKNIDAMMYYLLKIKTFTVMTKSEFITMVHQDLLFAHRRVDLWFNFIIMLEDSTFVNSLYFDDAYDFVIKNNLSLSKIIHEFHPPDDCIVCYKTIQIKLGCSHYMCYNCRIEWDKKTCPMCKRPYTVD